MHPTSISAHPAQKPRNGRDHHIYGFSGWMAGGGIKGGNVCGATDELGFHAVQERHYLTDVHATVLHQLGLDAKKLQIRGDAASKPRSVNRSKASSRDGSRVLGGSVNGSERLPVEGGSKRRRGGVAPRFNMPGPHESALRQTVSPFEGFCEGGIKGGIRRRNKVRGNKVS